MRKSVLTGIFACTLIFVASADKASAIEISTTKTNDSQSSLINIETINETPKSPLLTMVEVPVEPPVVQTPKVITHIVTANETLSDIAKLHQTTWNRLYDKNINIADPNILTVGTELIIPESTETLAARSVPLPVVEAPQAKAKTAAAPKTSSVPRASVAGNGYVAGYCTWYVKNRRPDMPNNLGNASTWVSRARAQGMATGSAPAVGAVGQRGNHVVYVESVNGDGTVTISEMNHKGRYVHTTRTVPASYFSYIY